MASLHDAARRAELRERLRGLRPDSAARFGSMTPDQMLWHLGQALSMAVGDLPTKPYHTAFRRNVFRWIALYGPWPKGKIPTSPELNARAAHHDFAEQRARLEALIEKVGAKPLTDAWPVHPGFGPLSGRQWSRLQSRHIQHHLEQFGA